MTGSRFRLSSGWAAVRAMIVCVLAATPPAMAEDPLTASDDSGWRVEANTWLWLFGVSGDVGRGPVVVDVDESFSDIADEADSIAAFSGRVEVGKGRLAGFIDGTYADVEFDNRSGALGLADIDVSMEIAVLDFGLLYTLTEWDSGTSRVGSLEVYGGGRYLALELGVDPALLPSREGDSDIIDPMVGLRLVQPMGEDWALSIWGDVGGGGDSDLTWSATGVIGYHFEMFSMPATAFAGYRAIAWDYEDGSGLGRVKFDAVLHGPTLGLHLAF